MVVFKSDMSRPTFGDDAELNRPDAHSHKDDVFGAFECPNAGTAGDGVYAFGPYPLVPFVEMHPNNFGARQMESSMNVLLEEAPHQSATACDCAHEQTCFWNNVAPIAGRFSADFSQATYLSTLPTLPLEDDEAIIGRQASEALLSALEPPLLATMESYTPTQDMFAANHTPITASNSESSVPDLSFVSTPHVDIGMDAIIGTIRLSGDIRCQHLGCTPTFGRLTELRRHYTEFHAVDKPVFWCNEPTCGRGSIGGRPFHRRDKKRDHERKMHYRGVHRKRH
ncbi:hypothetical protein BKA58DRAFT_126218 [Alternaria rosae]|uniref:uncharacterized protein n=1 Tax=Alternaria rosae TaxID=1187941 RepID=UPI001E8E8449|nr:uncharacterized protein BKA58DRAFT_126218 [Alternaria rosae]KAH6875684.1 hypothetical protein BKA58DRAFT_126218 [Alternaria rosae]